MPLNARRPRRRNRRRSVPAANAGRTSAAVRNRNTQIATRALNMAKSLQKNVDIEHWKYSLPTASLTSTSNWTVDGADMTTGATAVGWLSNYTGSKTGVFFYTLGHMNRSTTNTVPGYRYGDTTMIRNFWLKLRMTGNVTANTRFRVMLLKVKGKLEPEDLPFYDNASSTPELETFTDKGKTSKIQKVLLDKVIVLRKYDNSSSGQIKWLNIFRRVNTKYFYRAPTLGDAGTTGDPDGLHDIAEGSPNYYLVFANDGANTLTVDGNAIINYIP